MSDLSRRSLLAGVPAAAFATVPAAAVAAVAVATGADPVFAAIEAHRAVWQAFDDAVGASEDGAYVGAVEIAGDVEESSWADLLDHPCATFEAVKAKADYLLNCPRAKGCAWEDWQVELLLRSIAGGAHG